MRAVIQRVDSASVKINHQDVSSINKGVLILLGVKRKTRKSIPIIFSKKHCIYVYLKMIMIK
jgi:D-Tyr-tRNAtyr deacylase